MLHSAAQRLTSGGPGRGASTAAPRTSGDGVLEVGALTAKSVRSCASARQFRGGGRALAHRPGLATPGRRGYASEYGEGRPLHHRPVAGGRSQSTRSTASRRRPRDARRRRGRSSAACRGVVPSIELNSALRRHVPCPSTDDVPGSTVREALRHFCERYPAIRGYLFDDQGWVRRHVSVFVDGAAVVDRTGLSDRLSPTSTVWVAPALSGGGLLPHATEPPSDGPCSDA